MKDNFLVTYKNEINKMANLGYNDFSVKNIDPNLINDFHYHDFNAFAYVDGEFIINDQTKEYVLKTGDEIEVKANQVHSKKTTSIGAKILLGKKNL